MLGSVYTLQLQSIYGFDSDKNTLEWCNNFQRKIHSTTSDSAKTMKYSWLGNLIDSILSLTNFHFWLMSHVGQHWLTYLLSTEKLKTMRKIALLLKYRWEIGPYWQMIVSHLLWLWVFWFIFLFSAFISMFSDTSFFCCIYFAISIHPIMYGWDVLLCYLFCYSVKHKPLLT